MVRWLVVVVVAVCPLLPWLPRATSMGPGAGNSPNLPKVDRFVADRLAAANLPGAALAVVRGDEVLHVRGFGHTGDGGPVRPSTQFRIASLTKAFTATAVLRLVEAGRVGLDTPVHDYLPDFHVADRRGKAITVRYLLNQTSGLADTGFPEQTMPPPPDLHHRVTSLHEARLVSTPGTTFHYFNPNYDVLARLVEVVTGQRYDTYLRSTIFEPLDMHDSLLVPTGRIPAKARNLHDGYILAYGMPIARPELHGFLGGNASVVSTAGDMAHWLVAQGTGGYDGHRLLRASSLRLMHTPPSDIDTSYGMGWMVEHAADGSTRLAHDGVLSTYNAQALLDPHTGTAVVVLFNSGNALAPYHSIAEGVLDILDGRQPADGLPFIAVELPLAYLTVLVLAVRAYLLARSRSWATRRRSRRYWRIVPGMLWLLLPTALLIALPDIVATFAGRVFTRHEILRSMPTVHGFLGVAAVTGLALIAARTAFLVRGRRSGR